LRWQRSTGQLGLAWIAQADERRANQHGAQRHAVAQSKNAYRGPPLSLRSAPNESSPSGVDAAAKELPEFKQAAVMAAATVEPLLSTARQIPSEWPTFRPHGLPIDPVDAT
jgi:hypothetical protein